MTVMNLLQWFVDLPNASAAVGANLLVQTTLVIGGGLFAAWLFRRNGAAVQSAILRATIIASLVCPVTSWVLSSLGVPGFRVVLPQGSLLVTEAGPQEGPVSTAGGEIPWNDASSNPAPNGIGDSVWRRSGTGRVLDKSGAPLRGKLPHLSASKAEMVYGYGANGVMASTRQAISPIAWTDSDAAGRFEFASVPPGSGYTIVLDQQEFTTPVVTPGERIDLGDLWLK